MELRCKPLQTIYTAMSDDELLARIKIIDQDKQELELFETLGGRNMFCKDHPHTVDALHGYMIVMHHCRHGSESDGDVYVEGSEGEEREACIDSVEGCAGGNNEEDENSQDEEYKDSQDQGDIERIPNDVEVEDYAEALFLRMKDEAGEHFERVGLLLFQGSDAVDQILRLHRRAEDRVITLV
jgi:hypothetical protein